MEVMYVQVDEYSFPRFPFIRDGAIYLHKEIPATNRTITYEELETVEECQYDGDRAVDDSLEELYAEINALTCEVEYLRAKVEAAEKAECDW